MKATQNYSLLRHKATLGKFKITEIMSTIFSNHNSTELEISRKKTGKFTNVEIKQHATEQPIGQRILIKIEIKNILG